jgi:hypothetical protein
MKILLYILCIPGKLIVTIFFLGWIFYQSIFILPIGVCAVALMRDQLAPITIQSMLKLLRNFVCVWFGTAGWFFYMVWTKGIFHLQEG